MKALLFNSISLQMNHFELFKLPCQFELDGSSLSTHFHELQRRFHPDKFATASERDRLLSVQKSAHINEAYQTLLSPLRRAEYMLFLHGFNADNEQQTMQDVSFLMEQMALREELEEIAERDDASALLFIFEQKVTTYYADLLFELTTLLNNQQWLEAESRLQKFKFIVKLTQEIERIEDRLLG